METIKCQITVFFEDPFWVAVYERITNNKLEVCKITFGAEPKDYEIYIFFLTHGNDLPFTSPTKITDKLEVKINPKRLQREIKKQLQHCGVGTKSQQALKLQQEENKLERRQQNRRKQEKEKQFKFALKQQKKKAKHRGH